MKPNKHTAPEGFLIFNDQGQIALASPAASLLFGYKPDEAVGMNIQQIIPEGKILGDGHHTEIDPVQIRASTVLRTKGIKKGNIEFMVELSLSEFHGSSEIFTIALITSSDFELETTENQLEMSDERHTQELVNSLANVETINRDLQLQIQKRKSIEEKLIKIQRIYDTMVHNFPDGVIGVLNRDMKYVLLDGKELNEIDLPALGLTGLKVSETQDPTLAQETLTQIKKAFDGQSVSFEVETKDRFYNISAVPLPDAQNNFNEILCVLKNVTERKRMEDGLKKALEREKELGELKSRFVTMASHEFKTPLATILSSTFLLENYSGEAYEKEKMVHTNRIKRSVNNLTLILNEFLTLERLEENQVKVVNVDINIPKYIGELISEVEPAKKKAQIIEYEHTGDLKTAFLDHHLLWSIITNLISNAVKYSSAGAKIFLSTEMKDNLITIRVKDNGMGIPEDEQKHIFERFYRARNAMNLEGTGLGLHIVEKNVKLFDGKISFSSELNVGTEFTVILPDGHRNNVRTHKKTYEP